MEPGRHWRGFPNYSRPRSGLPTGQLARLAWPHFSSGWLEPGCERTGSVPAARLADSSPAREKELGLQGERL